MVDEPAWLEFGFNKFLFHLTYFRNSILVHVRSDLISIYFMKGLALNEIMYFMTLIVDHCLYKISLEEIKRNRRHKKAAPMLLSNEFLGHFYLNLYKIILMIEVFRSIFLIEAGLYIF